MLCSNWPKARNPPPATPNCDSFADQGFYVAPRLRALCVPVLYGEPGIFLSSSLVSFFSRVIFTVCAPLHHGLSEAREAPVDNEGVSPHKHRLADYLRPKTLAMLLLWFSSGLPFYLVGNTFGFWLRDEHTSLTAIGFLSWVGIAYSLKFLWAPLMDRVDLPLFKRLGHRRGWMMFSQIAVGLALAAMGGIGPKAGLGRLGAFALIVAFASSTQDIVVDAWRIESADNGEEQGLLASAYQFSYRLALLATDSAILIVAAAVGWRISYGIYGACMAIGMVATWFAKEPGRADAVLGEKKREAQLWTLRGFFDAVVGPF